MFRSVHAVIFSKTSLLLIAVFGIGFSSVCLANPAPSNANPNPSFATIMGDHLLRAQEDNKKEKGIGSCSTDQAQCDLKK